MFKIGDFSKLSRVPVKTLRYYDEIGLLKPVGVDRFTRYRRYALEQLVVLNRILGLKELGFSLEQIGQLLEGELSQDQLRRMLVKRRSQVENQIELETQQLQRLDACLREIDQAGRMPVFEVLQKSVNPIWIAAASGLLPGYGESEQVVNQLFEQVRAYLEQKGIRTAGPAVAIYHDPQGSGEELIVQAGFALPGPADSGDTVKIYQLPALESAASVVHHGSFATLGRAYSALLTWVQDNQCLVSGPTRELVLRFDAGGDPTDAIIEIQIPVKKIKEQKKMEPKIVQLEAFKVVGLPYIGDNENNEISKMWGVFNQRSAEIKHLAPIEAAYGVCFAHPTARMEYVACYQVNELADIPPGMVGKDVPAQEYVVFGCNGLENIMPTYHKIIHEWLPANGCQPGDGPDFEYYDAEFDPLTASGVLYIYFPIKRA